VGCVVGIVGGGTPGHLLMGGGYKKKKMYWVDGWRYMTIHPVGVIPNGWRSKRYSLLLAIIFATLGPPKSLPPT